MLETKIPKTSYQPAYNEIEMFFPPIEQNLYIPKFLSHHS